MAAAGPVAPDDLVALPGRGVAHAHWRLAGRDLVVRVPRHLPAGQDPAALLDRQAEAFRRAAAGFHVPRLHAVVPPEPALPLGALVVDAIDGRTPILPADMGAIGRALASLHGLPVPPAEDWPPLAGDADPLAGLAALVARQAGGFAVLPLDPAVRAALKADLAWATALAADPARPPAPVTLAGADTHPGNFLIDGTGKAWFVDLERAIYGCPAMDLAHASLYTSTRWDPAVDTAPTPAMVAALVAAWMDAVPPALADAVRPWLGPFRRLTWLRTMSWMAAWQAGGRRMNSELDAHIDRVIADFFAPATVAAIRAEWA